MKYGKLASWIIGVSLAGALGTLDCGGDDSTGTTGSAGSAGASGAGGTAGAAGSATGTAGKAGGGTAGSGTAGSGTAGSGTAGSGTAGSGTAGSGGTAGGAGSSTGGTAGGDAAADASDGSKATGDSASDAPDGAVAFSAVTAIFEAKCAGCHRPTDAGAQRIDLITPAGRYDRLTTPLPTNQEGRCGFPVVEAGTPSDASDLLDATGADVTGDLVDSSNPVDVISSLGDGSSDGSTDSGVLSNRQAIVPGDPSSSLLYLKVTGTQPAGCGARMPRKNLTADDGGPAGSVGCDQADGGAANNCLTQTELDTILHWIQQGAPNN